MLAAWDVIGDDAPAEIVIRFDPTVTQRVHETRWHHSQVEELEDDGSLLWRARVSGVLEIRSWILGWGPAAEVLEPAELREWVAAAARRRRRPLRRLTLPFPCPNRTNGTPVRLRCCSAATSLLSGHLAAQRPPCRSAAPLPRRRSAATLPLTGQTGPTPRDLRSIRPRATRPVGRSPVERQRRTILAAARHVSPSAGRTLPLRGT